MTPSSDKNVAVPTGQPGTVLILGATSGIARGIAQSLARRGFHLILAGRHQDDMSRIGHDLTVRYEIRASTLRFDALDTATHGEVVRQAVEIADGQLTGVVMAFGLLGDQERAVREFSHAEDILRVNFLGAVSALTHVADHLEQRGGGFIVALSSIAGDRGRKSNYTYGAAKAGLSAWLQGLRGRLHPAGVHVLTVKPGFVDTEMTYGRPGMFLVADPAVVGERIVRAIEHRKQVVYVPGFWRLIMLAIRMIPERVFRRLKF